MTVSTVAAPFTSWPGKQPIGFTILAAMIPSILFGKPSLLCLGAEFFRHFALSLQYHIAALRHAKRLLEQSEMIEFGSRRVVERFEP
jgi:hypothetical protein